MPEIPIRRRRWPLWLLAVVLLLIAGPIAWRWRPLNATERALLGTWRIAQPNVSGAAFSSLDTTYTADRRWVIRNPAHRPLPGRPAPAPLSGTWSAVDGRLSYGTDSRTPLSWRTPLAYLRRSILGQGPMEHATFYLEGADTLHITFDYAPTSPAIHTRVRESPVDQPASPASVTPRESMEDEIEPPPPKKRDHPAARPESGPG